jgi:hypothetical protein
MRRLNQITLLILILMITPETLTQTESEDPQIEEGYFCSSDAECSPPQTICIEQNGINMCKRKEIFPLYGKHFPRTSKKQSKIRK